MRCIGSPRRPGVGVAIKAGAVQPREGVDRFALAHPESFAAPAGDAHRVFADYGYKRQVRTFRELKLGRLKPLDEAIPELSANLPEEVDDES